MIEFIYKRILQSVLVIFLISVIAFSIIDFAPGDPALALYGGEAQQLTPAERVRINHNFGFDRPLVERYAHWFTQVLHGNLGISYREGRLVSLILAERLPNTILLFGVSFFLIVVLALYLGLKGGFNPGSGWEKILSAGSIIFSSIPSFWLGIFSIMFFSVFLQVLPSSGVESIHDGGDLLDRICHLILPVMVMVVTHVGLYARFIQEQVRVELKKYYVLTAKANGLAAKFIKLGVLRNACIPFLNYLGLTIPGFFGGSIIIESLFAWSGLGQLNVKATLTRDYPLLMGSVLISGTLVVTCIFLTDLGTLILNPKLRRELNQ